MSLIRKTAAELGAMIAAREVSATEVAEAHLDRMAEVEPQVQAFLHVDRETTLEQAADVQERLDLRSEEHTSELQSRETLVCRLLLEKKNGTAIRAARCRRCRWA